ncbi:hypothetical protein SLA2020_439560 [Shorea laevis]
MMSFRFYSQQWKTWAACFIQAAWHRYCKRKLDKSLREAEERLQDALANEAAGTSQTAVTIYASGLLPMHFEPRDKRVHPAPECHKDCYRCCHRSLLSPISLLKIIKSMVFQVIIM